MPEFPIIGPGPELNLSYELWLHEHGTLTLQGDGRLVSSESIQLLLE
jgi:hypothetical protein